MTLKRCCRRKSWMDWLGLLFKMSLREQQTLHARRGNKYEGLPQIHQPPKVCLVDVTKNAIAFSSLLKEGQQQLERYQEN
mmetsp:Transcript_17560/g.33572  ORF Transcript_17560/g.33572 Transcript_17560/m.33572 type:complete len:80 (-) Transcript_17560:57-296(-)